MNTHTHTHRQRETHRHTGAVILSVSLLFKQSQPAVTTCMGSFLPKQSFQTLAFRYNLPPGYIPGSALLVFLSLLCLSLFPVVLTFCSAVQPSSALNPAAFSLLVLWVGAQCVARARGALLLGTSVYCSTGMMLPECRQGCA